MTLTIGVVIPCYKPHIHLLKRLFDSIEGQTKKPDMVIVSCSSSEESDIPYKQEDYSFSFKIHTHKERKNQAQNRNYGAKLINTDIISFIDADDIMHPQRIEIIYNILNKHKSTKLLLHSFKYNPNDFNFPLYNSEIIPIELDPFYVCQWGSVQLKHNRHRDIHNAHSSIRKELIYDIQFNESEEAYRKEDTVFNADVIKKYPNNEITAYCSYDLSYYFTNSA